ncbi:MAG: low-specificity L-threonine aldolase [Myxococcota bacterium]|nr:low-specificity L-threonine aldolase [Myxococcota bacterium]
MRAEAPIDLRSDTVTRPTPGMRRAMAEAEVGDDVCGEDPTVLRLQGRAAELTGKERALFVPSGTMANQIALLVHCERGDDVIIGEGTHCAWYESGAGAAWAGVQFAVIPGDGLFDAERAAAAMKPRSYQSPTAKLVVVENTHNRGGGRVWPQAEVERVAAWARDAGMAVHLDGARVFNASVASGRPVRELAAPADTVSFCLSKGLGAPVGSLLCGPEPLMMRAHRYRKMLGGGMRQAGILAAAGLWALEHHVERLAEDHANARALADAPAGAPGIDRIVPPETNIVMVDLSRRGAAEVIERLKAAGVLAGAVSPSRIRLVTHLDVDREAVLRAARLLREAVA